MFPWLVLAQDIEREIETALHPMGPLLPQPFPWSQILLTVGIFATVVFFLLFLVPRIAGNALKFGGILSIAAAALLSVFLPFTLYALRSPTKILIEAAPGSIPENVSLTNITSNDFTVEWQTQAEVVGMIKYGTNPEQLDFFALDEKGNLATTTHRIVVKNLWPKTKYYFEVVSGPLRFNNPKKPLELTTKEAQPIQ